MRRGFFYGGAAIATAAVAIGLLWPRDPDTPSPYRQELVSLDQKSPAYLSSHALQDLECPVGSTKCLRCLMQDSFDDLACDDQNGATVELADYGTPNYQMHTPIHRAKGWVDPFDAWVPVRASVIADTYADPDGGTLADVLHEDTTASDYHYAYSRKYVYLGGTYRYRVFVKAINREWTFLTASRSTAGTSGMYFDLVNATTGGVIGATNGYIKEVEGGGGGWYEVGFDFECGSEGNSVITVRAADPGSVGSFDGLDQDSLAVYKPTVTRLDVPNGHKAIYSSDGTTNYFQASSNTPANFTTEDFSVTFWYNHRSGATTADPIVTNRGANGWLVGIQGSTTLRLVANLDTTTTIISGLISDSGLTPNSWNLITVKFDRSGNVHSYVNSVAQSTVLDISSQDGASINSPSNLTLLRFPSTAMGTSGSMAGLLIHDGLMDKATHDAIYDSAFGVPDGITYTQTSTGWKHYLGNETGFGVRLGQFAVDQWPVAQSDTAITSHNPFGLGFPAQEAVSNIIGYPNEFDSWTLGASTTVTANAVEGPDGSMADQIDCSSVASSDCSIINSVIGGGVVGAGERWCFRIKVKKLGGDCTIIRTKSDTGLYAEDNFQDSWISVSKCSESSGFSKYGILVVNSGTTCSFAVADAEYYETRLPKHSSCTNCTGNAVCNCNAVYASTDWSDRETYVPTSIERGELQLSAVVESELGDSSRKRTLFQLGDHSYLQESVLASNLVTKNQGGGVESVVRGRPVTVDAELREYRALWDQRNGLTNSNPRKYSSLGIGINEGSVEYQHEALSSRSLDDVEPPSQRGLRPHTLTVGCDHNGSNCSNALITDAKLWSRPAQHVYENEDSFVAAVDTTGPALLNDLAMGDLCDYDFGVPLANRFCWNFQELGGNIKDTWNDFELTKNGTPTYQVFPGVLSRGQGRRGVWFISGNSVAASGSQLDIGSGNSYSVQVIIKQNPPAAIGAARSVFTGADAWATGTGPMVFIIENNSYIGCRTIIGGVGAITAPSTGSYPRHDVMVGTCSWERTDPLSQWFVRGCVNSSCTSAQPTGLTGDLAFSRTAFIDPRNSVLYELQVFNDARTESEHIADYERTIRTGRLWTDDDANVIGHYAMNETSITNGVGLRDISGNGNHLTVVSGTPDAQYRDAPYPMGSGAVERGIGFKTTSDYFVGASGTATPTNRQPYSVIVLAAPSADTYMAYKSYGSTAPPPGFLLRSYNNMARFILADGTTLLGANSSNTIPHGTVGLFVGKYTWSGTEWLAHASLNGTPFTTSGVGSGLTGDTGAVSNIMLGNIVGGPANIYGVMLLKDYELTDADVSSLYASLFPQNELTHARSSTGGKTCFTSKVDPIDGVQLSCFPDDKVPFAYSEDSCSIPGNEDMCLAEPVMESVTNLVPDSLSWTAIRSTLTSNVIEGPDGTLTAVAVTEDTTAAQTHYAYVAPTVAAADHATKLYLKKGSRWGARIEGDSGGCMAYINLSDCSVGTTSNIGSIDTEASVGWCEIDFTCAAAWTAGARLVKVHLAEADNDYVFDGDPTTYPDGLYIGGGQVVESSSFSNVYCPTNGAAQTCNAPTSNYLAASEMTSWDRSSGVISNSTYINASSPYGFDLHNGSNDNGAIRNLIQSGGNRIQIYDASSVLQQRLDTTATSSPGVVNSIVTYDSAGTIYSTRRSFAEQCADTYPEEFNWTTDTGSNWTATSGTNLNVGKSYGGNYLNGYHNQTYIWTR